MLETEFEALEKTSTKVSYISHDEARKIFFPGNETALGIAWSDEKYSDMQSHGEVAWLYLFFPVQYPWLLANHIASFAVRAANVLQATITKNSSLS
jgi:hypothetical protein